MSDNFQENKSTMPPTEGSSNVGGGNTETNPFTDLNEFTSSFETETGTNAMSQLLNLSSDKAKKIKLAAAAAGILVVGYVVMSTLMPSSDDEFDLDSLPSNEELAVESELEGLEDLEEEMVSEEMVSEEMLEEEFTETAGEEMVGETDMEGMTEATEDAVESGSYDDPALAGMEGTEVPVLASPADGQSRSYDETSEYAEFTWSGSPGGYIFFSRSPSMVPVEHRYTVNGNSFRMRHPWPGTWYWKVQNGAGESAVSSFNVDAPMRRNLAVDQPQMGGALSGNGGVVSWTGDTAVARYKVEFAQSSFTNPEYKFQTSSSELQVSGVPAGAYKMRVGAFSEVSGRWEYTQPQDVTVQ